MTNHKPIHIILRVNKEDVDYSISEWSKKKYYIWWSYRGEKSPISDPKIELLNENIHGLNSSLVYFCDDKGEYVKKAKLLAVEGEGTKSEETDDHIPKGWGGDAQLWLKCDNFEDGSLDDLKPLLLYNDPTKSYLNLDPSRRLYPFATRNALNLVVETPSEIEKSVWRIALGQGSFFWDYCKKGGFIVIGWSTLGDLSNIKTLEELKNLYLKKEWGNTHQAGKDCPQIWSFIREARIGDIVLVRKGQNKLLGVGEVKSDYYVDYNRLSLEAKKAYGNDMDKKDYSSIRDVKWFEGFPAEGVEISQQKDWIETIKELKKEKVEQIFHELKEKGVNMENTNEERRHSLDIFSYISSKGFYFSKETITNYYLALRTKPFVILTGISGTGKTKIAQLFAEYMCTQGSKDLKTIDKLITEFLEYKKQHSDYMKSRIEKQEKFRKLFSVQNLKKASDSDFENIIKEFIYYHGRIRFTGSWRSKLVEKDNLKILKKELIQFLENENTQPLESVIEKFLDSMPGGYKLFLTAVLHDYSPEKYIPYNNKIRERLQRVGLWDKSIETKGTFAEQYIEINKKAIDFAKKNDMTTDDFDYFLWWVEDKDYRVDSKIAQEVATKRYVFVSVRPDWMDNRGILGFYNPLTEKYEATELIKLLLRARGEYEEKGGLTRPYFVILDEMNLAKVEQYFSDFLSCLESRTPDNPDGEPIILHNNPLDKDGNKIKLETEDFLEIPDKIKVTPNIYFSGTVNIDETTYMFSPKVLDRANVIEFNEVNLSHYFGNNTEDDSQFILKNEPELTDYKPITKNVYNNAPELEKYMEHLKKINQILKPHNMHFGYRVVNEVGVYLKNAEEMVVDYENKLDEAFDFQVRQKILTKFHGSRQKIEKPLQDMFMYLNGDSIEKQNLAQCKMNEECGKLKSWETKDGNSFDYSGKFSRSAAKILRMLKDLHEQGFASYIE